MKRKAPYEKTPDKVFYNVEFYSNGNTWVAMWVYSNKKDAVKKCRDVGKNHNVPVRVVRYYFDAVVRED